MAECRSCGAAITWAETQEGKRQPFDREPNPDGNRVLLGQGSKRPPLALPLANVTGLPFGNPQIAYMPHHATCPDREQWAGSTRKEHDG